MTLADKSKPLRKRYDGSYSFDITQVIDTIEVVPGAEGHTPRQAAFLAIANCGQDGTFQFAPDNDGVITSLTVETGTQTPNGSPTATDY